MTHLLRPGGRGTAGFTLVEMLVVLGIMALLATLIAPQVTRYLGKAKTDTAAAQLKNLEGAIELYFLDTGSYPPAETGLESLISPPAETNSWNGPYLKGEGGVLDPWGRRYVYVLPGEHGDYGLYSYGRDGEEGGEGENRDITNW